MQLHSDVLSVDIVQEVVVHADHVLRREAISGFVSRHHRGGVQLEQIKAVGTEGGGFVVAQELQRRRRQRGADYLKLHEVLSALELKRFIKLLCLVFISDICFESAAFAAVGNVPELS